MFLVSVNTVTALYGGGGTILDGPTQPSLLKCPLPPQAETGGSLPFPPGFSPQTLARRAEDLTHLLI